MILGHDSEESCARLNNGDFIWFDYEKEKLAHQPLVEERFEDDCMKQA